MEKVFLTAPATPRGKSCRTSDPATALPSLWPDGARTVQIPAQRDCSLKEIVQHNTATVERGVLARVLRETGGNKAEAARLLHIDYKTIQLKIKV